MFAKKYWTHIGNCLHNYGMASLIFTACMLCMGQPALAGTIDDIRISQDRVEIAFDDIVAEATAFTLTGPNRIALDIKGATAGKGVRNAGWVRNVRQGQFDPATARVVFDLDRPAYVASGGFSADGKTLTLTLAPQEGVGAGSGAMRKSFLPPPAFRAKPPSDQYSVSVPLGKPKASIGLPKIYGPNDPRLPLVVIDAGHGGHDPGAISPHGGAREKMVTLAIAKAIRDRLVAGGRVRVALTREGDNFLVLQERYGIARRLKADLFISVHADAAGSEEASGATIYTLSEVASDREAAKLAARENKADIINGFNLGGTSGDVTSILIDLTQRETMNVSADFARLLHREADPYMNFRNIPHRFASFVVLKAPDTPSVLFETGYLTNAQDVTFLNSASGRRKVADGVAKAIEVHFARRLAQR